MAIHNYRTTSEHKRPVAAGTVIVFKLEPEPPGDHRIQWHINGPFTNMTRDMPGGPTFDWDTEGERAGSYEVFACVYPPSSTNPDDTGGQPGMPQASAAAADIDWSGNGAPAAAAPAIATKMTLAHDTGDGIKAESWTVQLTPAPSVNQEGVLPVSLQRTALVETVDQALWVIIRDRTNAVGFRPYKTFIDNVMGGDLPFRGGDAYALLKFATDAFLMQEVGVLDPLGVIRAGLVKDNNRGTALMDPESAFQSLEAQLDDPTQSEALRTQEERRLGRPINLAELKRMRDSYYVALKEETPPTAVLPYLRIIRERLADIPLKPPGAVPRSAYGILRSHLTAPLAVELIWSYWHEEGMLAQTLNAILARFQNRRITPDGRPDPLARFDIDPLRPIGNVFWGWMQDEVHRLTVRRRHFEYEHEYGLALQGTAIPPGVRPVDRRSKFLEALHNLLYLCHIFFKEDDDTTVIADGFPVLNALRETHLLLAEGAHNQFMDLPATARSEMLVMEWMLARPELRDFLGGRIMVPYEEAWMDRVDSMKSIQGWTDISITHFRDLGVFGEQILLSIRYGNWSVENDPQTAANWARYWRPEIQRYVHAYRASTGVDLTEQVDSTLPAVMLRRRLAVQQRAQLDGGRRRELPPARQYPPRAMIRGRAPLEREYE